MPRSRPSRTNPEALDALRARLQATQEAAQRLAEEASRSGRDQRPPPNGWDVPRHAEETGAELDAIVGLLTALRDVLPDELRAQLAELVRQLLLFVRAVLDWWIERMEAEAAGGGAGRAPGDEPGAVQDIPIA